MIDHPESFRFTSVSVSTLSEVGAYLSRLSPRTTPQWVVVVFDGFEGVGGSPGAAGPWVATVLEPWKRTFEGSGHLVQTVAVVGGRSGRIPGVDLVVSPAGGHAALRLAVLSAATPLRRKAPPPDAEGRPVAYAARCAATEGEVFECLVLRRLVYGMMGYLPDEVLADPSGLEADGYDLRSLQLVAVHDGVIGTARLILDGVASPLGDEQARWCASFVAEAGPGLKERVARTTGALLPIFGGDPSLAERGEPVGPVAEASRLVVDPRFRGRGISTALMHAAIGEAGRLGCAVLLGECIRAHEGMYSRYGFRRIARGAACRGGDLDQDAVGMYLNLSEAARRLDPFGEGGGSPALQPSDSGYLARVAGSVIGST